MPLLFLLIGGLGLPGGAVYIDRSRLRSRHWSSAVSLAGPLSNALLAVLPALPFRLGLAGDGGIWPGLAFLEARPKSRRLDGEKSRGSLPL